MSAEGWSRISDPHRLVRWGLIASALISAPFPPLTMWSLFMLAWFVRRRFATPIPRAVAAHPYVSFAMCVFVGGLVLEVLAWVGSWLSAEEHPALFHPQLIPDLAIGSSVYLAWAVAWALVARFWRLSIVEVVVVHAVYGVVFEQSGAILLSFNPLLWLFVAATYGGTLGLAFITVEPALRGSWAERFGDDRRRAAPWSWVAALLTLSLLTVAFSLAWSWMPGILPDPGFIRDRPFW